MRMKDLYKIVLIIAVAFLWHSCGNSDSEVMPTVRPDDPYAVQGDFYLTLGLT